MRSPTGPIDLVITTGPRTSAANIAMARHLKAKNVYFGFSKWPSDGFYTVLLTSEQRRAHPHRAYTLAALGARRDASCPMRGRSSPTARAGMPRVLFGGQSKHYYYTMADMEQLAGQLTALARALPWLKWTFFNSRRSPEGGDRPAGGDRQASGAPVEFVRFSERGLLSNNPAFGSDLVLVTADSMSMLAESIASRRPTGILFADRYKPPERDAIEHRAMIADRRAFPITYSGLTADGLLKGAAGLETLPGSQLEALYQTLARHGI